MESKLKKLKDLRRDIIKTFFIDKWDEVWFFKEWNGVKGYLGTGNIFFVAMNPSYGKTFPDESLGFFYRLLKKYNLDNAHVTDLIKLKLSVNEVKKFEQNKKGMKKQIKLLKEEIHILKPKWVISLGDKVKKVLDKYGIKSEKMCHYAYRLGKRDKINNKIEKDLKKCLDKITRL